MRCLPPKGEPGGLLPLGFAMLSRVSASLLTSHSSQTLSSIFDDLSASLEFELYFHYEAAPDAGSLRLKSYRSAHRDLTDRIETLQKGDGVCGTVAMEGKPSVIEDVQRRADEKLDRLRALGIQAYGCYPLIAHGDLLGTLSFGSYRRT